MCQIICSIGDVVRRAPIECDTPLDVLERAIVIIEAISAYRFVAVERCVFADVPLRLGGEARSKAL